MKLSGISIPSSITSIGKESFYLCREMTDINIPNDVETIGQQAFNSCNKLSSL